MLDTGEKLYDSQLWEEIYNLNGFGLSDFLNDFSESSNFRADQHGNYVLSRYSEDGYTYWTPFFGGWSEWSEKVSYYHDSFCETLDSLETVFTYDDAKKIFVYKICQVMNLLDEDWTEIAAADEFLFC